MAKRKLHPEVITFLGTHPLPDSFGSHTKANDSHVDSGIPHRIIKLGETGLKATTSQLRTALILHHVSPENIERDLQRKESLKQLGYSVSENTPNRFPQSDKTRKGNLAEVFLAEYLVATSDISLPVYRLRYNPNVEQSMKGDDVLAFDFESEPVRILIGEAKFRGKPSKRAVTGIIKALIRSHQAGLPVSLQFVADRLFESGNNDLGQKVENCAMLIARRKFELIYVGLLMSNNNSSSNVNSHATNSLRNLVMISLGTENPSGLVTACYNGIEEESINGDTL